MNVHTAFRAETNESSVAANDTDSAAVLLSAIAYCTHELTRFGARTVSTTERVVELAFSISSCPWGSATWGLLQAAGYCPRLFL